MPASGLTRPLAQPPLVARNETGGTRLGASATKRACLTLPMCAAGPSRPPSPPCPVSSLRPASLPVTFPSLPSLPSPSPRHPPLHLPPRLFVLLPLHTPLSAVLWLLQLQQLQQLQARRPAQTLLQPGQWRSPMPQHPPLPALLLQTISES